MYASWTPPSPSPNHPLLPQWENLEVMWSRTEPPNPFLTLYDLHTPLHVEAILMIYAAVVRPQTHSQLPLSHPASPTPSHDQGHGAKALKWKSKASSGHYLFLFYLCHILYHPVSSHLNVQHKGHLICLSRMKGLTWNTETRRQVEPQSSSVERSALPSPILVQDRPNSQLT